MSIISCYKPECDREVELSCNCTSPVTFSCEKHLAEHWKSSNKAHNFSPIFLEPFQDTKEAILSFITEEITKTYKIKANVINIFSETISSLNNALNAILKGIDSDSKKINTCIKKVCQAQKVSRFEEDPVLSLLILQPDEAIRNAIAIFTENNNAEQLSEMGSQIDKFLKNFKQEISRIIQSENLLKSDSVEYMNFESEPQHIRMELNKYKEAIKIDPNKDSAYNGIGNVFKNYKRYEEAVKYYNDAIRINPNEAIYYTNKGDALWLLNRREEAIECYQEAIRIDPNEDLAYNGIGLILKNEKIYEEAIKYYNYAIRINQNNATYYKNKGNALNELGRKEEAIECLKEAIRINPNNNDEYTTIGNILYDKKRYEEALKYFNDVIRFNPNSATHHTNKGYALYSLGRREEAMKCFEEAIKIDLTYSFAYNGIGLILDDKLKHWDALQYFDNAIKFNPNEAIYYKNKANAIKHRGYYCSKTEAEECDKIASRLERTS